MTTDTLTEDYEKLKAVVPDPEDQKDSLLVNSRYTVHNATEALEPQPPLDYLVENLITRGSVNLFYGEPGSKKTYCIIHMGVCVAAGVKWLDFSTKAASVLIIDEESGELNLKRRLGEIMRGEAVDEDIPLQFVSIAGFNLDDKKDAVIIEALIEETGAELVIFDALADIMSGDENSKQETQPVFNTLRRIANHTNAALVVIHHSNKSGGYRGSSAIKANVDVMVKITSEEGSNIIDFKTEKRRYGEVSNFSATAAWTDNQFYLNATERDPIKISRESEKYVIRYLETNGASTIEAIESGADSCSARAARDAIYRLARLGVIHRTNPNAGYGKPAIYALT